MCRITKRWQLGVCLVGLIKGGCMLESIKSELTFAMEESASQAKEVIDRYYKWWKAQNKEALNLKSLGENINPGEIAPFIRKHATNGKVYITWVTWPNVPPSLRLARTSTFSKPIKAWSRGYTRALLESKCQKWEVETVLNTEKELSVHRDSINLCHKALVDINRLEKKHINRGKEL